MVLVGPPASNPNPRLISGSWSLYCTPALLRSPNAAQTSYWADDAHLSAGAQQIEADYEYSLIVAPSEISLLAEVPVVTRAAVVSSIFNQIPISQRQRAVGTFGAWVGGDVATLKMSTGSTGLPGDLGNPLSAILGIDYAFAPGWLIGGALSVATTTQNFDLGGNFKQSEFALSFYSGFAQGPIWANFAATYGGLHDNVNRAVPIGITMQSNIGSTSGTDTSLGAELGYNFTSRSALPAPSLVFNHGPLAGIVLQRVHVNGFNETDQFASIGGLTALSFADQTRNSAVSELGWQAAQT